MDSKRSYRLAIVFLLPALSMFVLVYGASAQITGEVISVTGRSVEIKLDRPGSPRPGDRVDLSYMTAAGAALSVGTWRVRTVRGSVVTADPVDSPTAPVVGLKARIYPPAKAGAKPPGKPGQPGGAPPGPAAAPAPVTPATAVWLGFDIGTIEGGTGGSGGILDGLQRIFGDNKGGKTGVAYVYSGGPAYKAGLRVEDIVIEVNGKPPGSPEDISRLVQQFKPGTQVSFTVERAGSRIPVTMTVEPLPQYAIIGDRAKEYYDKDRFADAVREYSRAIEMKSDVPQFYFYRGYSRYRLNQLEPAAADITRSIELNPQSPTGYAFRGLIRATMNQPDTAIADYDTALKISPRLTWIYRERAMVFAMKKKFNDALSDINRAIETGPQDETSLSDLYFERAKIQTDLQRVDDAMADINKAIELQKNNPRAWGYRCHLFNLRRDYRQALADCNRSIDLDRNLFAAYVTRAETYEAIGNTRQALADMRQALSLRPQEKYVQENVRRLTTKISGNR
jgi:tetratricopeptide (TPR) repeat protein